MLNRDNILNSKDITTEKLDVPEWGGEVHIKVMTSKQRDAYEEFFTSDKRTNMRARLAALTVCNPDGVLVFNNGDIEALGEKSALALSRVFNVAMRMNGYDDKEIDELEKK